MTVRGAAGALCLAAIVPAVAAIWLSVSVSPERPATRTGSARRARSPAAQQRATSVKDRLAEAIATAGSTTANALSAIAAAVRSQKEMGKLDSCPRPAAHPNTAHRSAASSPAAIRASVTNWPSDASFRGFTRTG